jgi:hypothetical protein
MKSPAYRTAPQHFGDARFPRNEVHRISAWRRIAVGAALVIAIVSFHARTSRAEGTLAFSSTEVYFGRVNVNSSSSLPVTVRNTGNAAVTFSNEQLAAPAQFTVTGFNMPVKLAVGGSLTFTVKFSATVVGTKSGTITFASNASNSKVVIWLEGIGAQYSISAVPSSASFGSVAVGSTVSQTIALKNTGNTTLTVSVAAAGSGLSVTGIKLPLSLTGYTSSSFTVAFSPKAAGAVSGSVTISGNFTTITVPVTGTGIGGSAALSASATSESFGNVTVGSSASATVNLTNSGNTSITISSVSASGSGVSASGGTNVILSPGQATPVTVKFAPTAAGAISGSVKVASNAAGSPLTIAVTGDGVTAPTQSYSVNLSWAPSTSSGVTGYDVFRSTVSGGPYTQIGTSSASSPDYTDSSVQANTEYFYVVTSVDGSTQSAYSSQISVSIP